MTRELLSSTILYVFIFSIILTAPFNAVFSRYLADKFYMDEYANILPSFYTGILILGILGTGISIPVMLSLYFRGGIDLPFILAAYVFWMSSVLLFFSVTYLHATKDYKIIAIFFLVGMLVVVLTALVFRFVLRADRIHSILYRMAVGSDHRCAGVLLYQEIFQDSEPELYGMPLVSGSPWEDMADAVALYAGSVCPQFYILDNTAAVDRSTDISQPSVI